MRAYVIAMVRGLDGEHPVPMSTALEGSPLFLTRAAAERERAAIFGTDPDWTVRAVTIHYRRPVARGEG